MQVYIAAPYSLRADAQRVAHVLGLAGIACTARWLSQDDSATVGAEWAQYDLDDVRRANALVAINPVTWADQGTGGRHVELGAALILDLPVYLLGERTNLFHYHPLVTVCDSVADICTALTAGASR
jgi:hypothetical protein